MRLGIGPSPLFCNYVSAIFAKLQVADRGEAGLVARAVGLGASE